MALKSFRARTLAAIAAATLVSGGTAIAQQQSQAPAAQSQAQAQAQINPVTEAEIDQFVAANSEVSTIAQSARAELQATDDKAASQKIQATAQQDMMAAIQDEGLTPQRFTEIVQLARSDEELNKRLRSKMEGQG